MHPLRRFDQLLNGITMYRLMEYGLLILAGISVLFGAMGAIGYAPLPLVASFIILTFVCYGANLLMATLADAAPNAESSVITALILFFILAPPTTFQNGVVVAIVGLIAMASKYLLVYRRKHVFNPAAIAAVIVTLTGLYPVLWWVATPALLPFVVVLGICVARKIRRFSMVTVFIGAALLTMLVIGLSQGRLATEIITTAYASWPLVFFGTIMLTEPSTTPVRWRHQLAYGAGIGLLFASQLRLGPLATDPQTVLVLGNLVAFAVGPKYRLKLRFKGHTQLAPRINQYEFELPRPVAFEPGQYMEFTLHQSKTDGRGNRRTFSIASSPTEPTLKLGIKHYEPSSSFKTALQAMAPGTLVMSGQLAGNFTLPKAAGQKLLFVAGGIGITPFRSMLKYLLDTGQHRDIVLLYAVSDPAEVVYRDVLDAATSQVGLKLVVLTTPVTPAIITTAAPDVAERLAYISGPSAMVDNYRGLLRGLGVGNARIHTDHFSGY